MTKIFKVVSLVILCLALSSGMSLATFAQTEKDSGILCVSHGGDTAVYESNTKDSVLSAFDKGADFVSVNIRKNTDGELVLCSENKAEISGISLVEMIRLLGEENVLILDFADELRDEIYGIIENENAFSVAVMRINDKASAITEWLGDKNENLQVIGVYDSFVVFTAVSHIKTLGAAGMKIVAYESKNYFNEMFGSLVSKTIKSKNMPKAMALTYDPALCGQRSDSEDGWNDLIKKGFSVIETNNLDAFMGYINSNNSIGLELKEAYDKAVLIDTEKYNAVSKENLLDAIAVAEELLSSDFASNDELQKCVADIRLATENLALETGKDAQKGALNVTSGKVIAAVLVGIAIFTAQIYTYKMQKKKK